MHATTRNRILTGVSSVLLAGGVFLLFQGARDLWDWRSGQSTAEEEFQEYTPPKAQPESPRYTRIPLGTTVARLSIPRLGTNLYVIEGVDAKDLRRAPGHMPGT
jgi:sortase (surface protein transpeptidase)